MDARSTRTGTAGTLRARLAACGVRSLLLRTSLLAGGWWALCEGEAAGLAFAVPTVLLALLAGLWLPSPRPPRWSATGLVRFGLAFVSGSLLGGVDVARRALAPELAIDPAVVRHRLRLRAGPARHLFLGSFTLMPGTLAVDVEGDELVVHVLAGAGDALLRQLRTLEAHVSRALGEPLERGDA